MTEKVLFVQRRGQLANQMFQYMFARTLQSMVPGLAIAGVNMPEWGIALQPDAPMPTDALLTRRGHLLRPVGMARHLNRNGGTIVLRSTAMRLEFYTLGREHYRAMFPFVAPRRRFGDEHLVIQIRGGEILRGVHPDYTPLPLGYYRELIAASNRQPVFMGQVHGADAYSRSLRQAFPDAQFLGPHTPVEDFLTMMGARHVVMAVSTFSWLAAWFSEAETIIMPLAGIFNREQRPDVDLMPAGDSRYEFHRFPVFRWTGDAEQLEAMVGRETPEGSLFYPTAALSA